MKKFRVNLLLTLLFILTLGGEYGAMAIHAVAKEPEIEKCTQVATADTIKIYRCLDNETGFEFYANNLGFMLAEP